MRDAGATDDVLDHVAPAARLDGRPARRAHADLAPHHGRRPHGRRTRRRASFDPWQRLHDVENVLCTDSSVFPTSTGYGPTLTIVALAIRAARALAGLAPLTLHPPDA